MNNTLKGYVGFKGEKGDSAYEVALKNGFIGTEQDWLATLGTSSHFERCSNIYTTTRTNETILDIPDCYTSNSFIDVYVEGERLNSDEYTINSSTKKITITNPLAVAGTKVEIVTLTMSTNSLPIAETIDATSTNEVAPGTKAVYDLVSEVKEETLREVNTLNASKMDSADIEVVTGVVSNIAAGGTSIVDVQYPDGFTQANTNIIGKMVSSNNVYYDVVDLTDTTNGFPSIQMIALTDAVIRLWVKNTSTSLTRNGYYKITLLKK